MERSNQHKGQISKPDKQQCQLYQQIEQFVSALNRLPDAREVRQNKPRSAPQDILPMVF